MRKFVMERDIFHTIFMKILTHAYYQCLMQSNRPMDVVSKLVSYNVYFHQSIHTYKKRITINITVYRASVTRFLNTYC